MMDSNDAPATGVRNETIKKRKGAPSANEIFTGPVPVIDEATYGGDRIHPVPRRAYVNHSSQVG